MKTITRTGAFEEIAPGVARLGIVFVNVYFVGEPGEPWVLVDTGLPHTTALTREAAQARYGADARPEAIVLTHGHFDHAGSALALAEAWDVPIYAHLLELPFLTGQSDYPPSDSTMGGAIAFLARFFPHTGYNFDTRVLPLPEDGSVPGMAGWRWLHTPGHTPGHVSLFRDNDRTLVAGDALATMDLDSWMAQITKPRELCRPPAPFTPDWKATGASVERLVALRPTTLAAGHGLPMTGTDVPEQLERFAATLQVPPATTRYVPEPARFDTHGLVAVPPPVPDPLPRYLALGALGVALVAGFLTRRRR